ncbi:serine hydrolase domain-containing protein [Phenylobacterium sp.]|uniref:serine hydrolase domain-containing protein n=1 Tax=Phenylobacterium sp. TaxID=1871053 RepID=UPI0035B34736
MRFSPLAALAAILVLTTAPALAQDEPAAAAAPEKTAPAAEKPALIQAKPPVAPAPAPPAANPKAPIPYETFQKRFKPTAPAPARPAASAAATNAATAATAPAAPGPTPAVEPLPTAASGARLGRDEALPPAELEAYVDGVVKAAMARDHIAGVTVSIVQHGQIVLKKGYGFASLDPKQPVNPDATLFRIGSISKTFTWIALMNEVEAGRIRIDAPVNLYLPERLQVRDQGFRTPVRVVNLMDHSAGFEDRALGHLFERRYSRVRPLADYLRQERPRRVRQPGDLSSYSNYSVALAGEALTYVTGKPFEDLIEGEILRPLALSHTTFREPHPPRQGLPAPMPPELAKDASVAYRWTPDGFRARDYEYIGQVAPAGSASSTAADMARYMLMLLGNGSYEGTTIYGPKAAQAFRTPIRKTPPGINGWRHGFIDYTLPGGLKGFGHAGATMSFMSNMVVIPALDVGVFVSTNTDTGAKLANGLADQVVQEFYAPPQIFPRPGSPALKARAKVFDGYYVTTRRAYGGLEKFVDLLLGGASARVNADGRLMLSTPAGAKAFVPEGDPDEGRFIGADDDTRVAFKIADGRARSFEPALNAQTFQRKGFWMRPQILAVLAALSAIAAAATIGGVITRNRRDHRETSVQSRGSVIQNTQAALWLTALVLLVSWGAKASDEANVMYGWPGAELVIASACALVAAALTLLSVTILPAIWRGGRRVDSWSPLRKAAFSVTVLVYAAFSIVLGFWGVLTPWAG